jgi:hypothetical protein
MGFVQDALKERKEKKKVFSSPEQFWEAWINADELQKVAMVQTLSVFNMVREPTMKRALVNLVNSYLVDLHSYMANKMRYMTMETKQMTLTEENRYGSGESDEDVSQVNP